jgi:hypothetical protein
LGAAGIDVEDGKQILIANSAPEFVDGISSLLRDDKRRTRLGVEAAKLVRSVYDNDVVAKTLTGFLYELIQQKKRM